jgi:multidrug efflux pump
VNLPDYFIDRPIFASVLSALIVIVGGLCLLRMPVNEYPEVVPPTIEVTAFYPGGSPQVIAETVAAPLEQQLTGIEGMIYLSSNSSADGMMGLSLTFALGTKLEDALIEVQNRIQQATPRLPEEVRRLGVIAKKSNPNFTLFVNIISPEGKYDAAYLANYARLHLVDPLSRLPGMGEVMIFGSGEYSMRVWLDPDRLAALGMSVSEVVGAIREQNLQIAAGALGAQPSGGALNQFTITAQGRLLDEDQFGAVIVRASQDGRMVALRDVARIEFGLTNYGSRMFINNMPSAGVAAMQAPGSNAITLSDAVRDQMAILEKDFPDGLEYRIAYDPTVFVRGSIKAVMRTLVEAIILVVIVVICFLQTWRASVIPLCAVPVSLIGTFAVMLGFGFSINTISMFGLVLAIGIVVDDAIVVVENVQRNIALGLSPHAATRQAMREVVSPIIATAAVLCAVFVPTAFISGLTGQFYKQFAITIAISTVISAFNSLTLSPALCAFLLKPKGARPDLFTRGMNGVFGWFFRVFNHVFAAGSHAYVRAVRGILRLSVFAALLYLGFIGFTAYLFEVTPTAYLPQQDKQYLIAFAKLPEGASLDRTTEVMRRMSEMAATVPGIEATIAIPGLAFGFTNSSSQGLMFLPLKPFEERESPELRIAAIQGRLEGEFATIKEALVFSFPPPPIIGLSLIGGFKVQIEDTGANGLEALSTASNHIQQVARESGSFGQIISGFSMTVPQIELTIDRERMKQEGVPFTELSATLGTYLGSAYANDFNRFGRTYQVNVQADAEHRLRIEDIGKLRVRSASGRMIPLSTLISVREIAGPESVPHYNTYASADLSGSGAPGVSSDQAVDIMKGILERELPKGFSFDWTELVYQQMLAGNTAVYIFPLCVLLAFMVLAALYESWALPLVVILIVPMCLLCAMGGVIMATGVNNIFTQIGFIVLVGLACKNAILIVEFAKDEEAKGVSRARAVLTACRLRLRPILMTSLAFIMGVYPLLGYWPFSPHGAGAETRYALGVAVVSGLIGVTLFGLALTPVFYVAIRRWSSGKARKTPEI